MLKPAARIVSCVVFCRSWPERVGRRGSLMRNGTLVSRTSEKWFAWYDVGESIERLWVALGFACVSGCLHGSFDKGPAATGPWSGSLCRRVSTTSIRDHQALSKICSMDIVSDISSKGIECRLLSEAARKLHRHQPMISNPFSNVSSDLSRFRSLKHSKHYSDFWG